MSQNNDKALYSTGELAKLCGVSVRTVQYYDSRNILIPSELSEGGRRLYTEEDVNKLKTICFLRDLDISINSIGELFKEEQPQNVIELLLETQAEALENEIENTKSKLENIRKLKKYLKNTENFSVNSIGDIAYTMENKNKIKKMRLAMILAGIPLSILQCAGVILWITHGFWWLFVIWACLAIPYGIIVSGYYYKHAAYICPNCHTTFKPSFKEMFWANHTPTLRKLTCKNCGHKGFCVEVYDENN